MLWHACLSRCPEAWHCSDYVWTQTATPRHVPRFQSAREQLSPAEHRLEELASWHHVSNWQRVSGPGTQHKQTGPKCGRHFVFIPTQNRESPNWRDCPHAACSGTEGPEQYFITVLLKNKRDDSSLLFHLFHCHQVYSSLCALARFCLALLIVHT